MPVSALPNLDHVYAKWENRGPKGIPVPQNRGPAGGKHTQNGDADQVIRSGKQKWREKFGDNVKPLQRRRPREHRRVVAVPAETIHSTTIAQFKTSPSILPEHFSTQRPFMGHCCSCMPNSQKDLITSATTTDSMRNILDVRHELRGSGVLSRQFATLVYSWRTRTHHKYPELSMAVLTSQRVIDVIHAELLAEEARQDRAKLEKRARDILNKMKSKVSNVLTKLAGWFLHHFLSLMLGGLVVHKGQMKMVKTASQRGVPLLFMPLHRSHLDYIIVTFIMWNYDIKNPHIAAGDNLNIPLFSFLMRGLGGYFIRRKLDKFSGKKDLIYRSVLHSYMEQLLMAGENMEFFVEGGRSRTGKALQPKGGLLSIVIDSLTNGLVEDLYVVPCNISYEKLLDGNFSKEQMGIPKKKESFIGALRAIWAVMRNHYGNVRVDFAQPFSLKELLQACQVQSPTSSPESSTGDFSNPGSPPNMVRMSSLTSLYGTDVVLEDQRQLIDKVGLHILHSCVQTTAIMCSHMLAFLLLTKHRKGTSLSTLVKDFTWLREEVLVRKRDLGFSPSSSTRDTVCYALSLLGPNLVTWRTGGEADENEVVPCVDMPPVFELSYYSNHVISVFLLESLIVCSVIYLSDISMSTLNISTSGEVILMSREEIVETAVQLANLLKHEFITVPPCTKVEESLADTLDHLVTSELLKINDNQDYNTYENMQDRQWASRLSAHLSWADGDDVEDYYQEEQMLRVNLEHEDCKEKLMFFHSVLAPFFEAYLVTAHNIHEMTDAEMTETDFMKKLHNHAKTRVSEGVATYAESAALETLKCAVKSYKDLRIIDYYNVGGVSMLELHGRYDVRDSLNLYLQMLESLRW